MLEVSWMEASGSVDVSGAAMKEMNIYIVFQVEINSGQNMVR